jgi:excisionase family DNA binding protein
MVHGLLDAKAVGKLLGVNPRTIYKWHREGLIRGVRFSRLIRFKPSAIDTFLKREGILREKGTAE